MNPGGDLMHAIVDLVRNSPEADLDVLVKALIGIDRVDNRAAVIRLESECGNENWRHRVRELLGAWRRDASDLSGAAVALALTAADRADERRRSELSAIPIVTGPSSPAVDIREIVALLRELIGSAQNSIWLVSFGTRPVESIVLALQLALERNVEVNLLFETVEDSAGYLRSDAVAELRALLPDATIWRWPREKRLALDATYPGLLHAKLAIADARRVLISSANLSDSAMSRNLEVGVFLESPTIAGTLAAHFRDLGRGGQIWRESDYSRRK